MQFLIDVIPPKSRRYVYGVLSLLALAYGAWQAADGDWKAALTALVTGAVTSLAHATPNAAPDEAGEA